MMKTEKSQGRRRQAKAKVARERKAILFSLCTYIINSTTIEPVGEGILQ